MPFINYFDMLDMSLGYKRMEKGWKDQETKRAAFFSRTKEWNFAFFIVGIIKTYSFQTKKLIWFNFFVGERNNFQIKMFNTKALLRSISLLIFLVASNSLISGKFS